MLWFNSKRRRKKEALYVEKSIEDFLSGESGKWDWDDFTSCPLRNNDLDEIRKQALAVGLPLDGEGRKVLEGLLRQVQAISDQ